jgi:hypothetical protein
MQAKTRPKNDLLEGVLLEGIREGSRPCEYLYQRMFGEPPSDPPEPPSNVVPFPKRINPIIRRKILMYALEGE